MGVDEDVLGFEVAVHVLLAVHLDQGHCYLVGEHTHLIGVEHPLMGLLELSGVLHHVQPRQLKYQYKHFILEKVLLEFDDAGVVLELP